MDFVSSKSLMKWLSGIFLTTSRWAQTFCTKCHTANTILHTTDQCVRIRLLCWYCSTLLPATKLNGYSELVHFKIKHVGQSMKMTQYVFAVCEISGNIEQVAGLNTTDIASRPGLANLRLQHLLSHQHHNRQHLGLTFSRTSPHLHLIILPTAVEQLTSTHSNTCGAWHYKHKCVELQLSWLQNVCRQSAAKLGHDPVWFKTKTNDTSISHQSVTPM